MTIEDAIKFAEYAQIMADGKPDVQEFYKLAESALRQQEHFRDLTKKVEPQWISVKDRMPHVHQRVLVYCQSKTIKKHVTACMYMGGYFSRKVHDVTYWMPMPEPPAERTEKK